MSTVTMETKRRKFSLVDGFREIAKTYQTPQQLVDAITEMRLRHYRELPVSYEVGDLYRIAVENHWLDEIEPGKYRIEIPKTETR